MGGGGGEKGGGGGGKGGKGGGGGGRGGKRAEGGLPDPTLVQVPRIEKEDPCLPFLSPALPPFLAPGPGQKVVEVAGRDVRGGREGGRGLGCPCSQGDDLGGTARRREGRDRGGV
jgi:hypothetical protein